MKPNIFYHRFEHNDTDISSIYHLLSPARKEKIDKIKSDVAKRNSAYCEILLHSAIFGEYPKDTIDFQYEYGENGKPYLKDSNIFFSFSHSKDMVVCAVDEAEIGCDVEFIGEPNMKLAKRFFHNKEFLYLSKISDEVLLSKEFYRIWTMKESYIKYTGNGLSTKLDSFCVLDEKFDEMITTSPVGDYYISVCSNHSKVLPNSI